MANRERGFCFLAVVFAILGGCSTPTTQLHEAVRKADIMKAETIMQKNAFNACTALWKAIEARNERMVRYFLTDRAREGKIPSSPNCNNGYDSALTLATMRGYYSGVEILLAAKADANWTGYKGDAKFVNWSPLDRAYYHRQQNIARLIENAGGIRFRSNTDITAMWRKDQEREEQLARQAEEAAAERQAANERLRAGLMDIAQQHTRMTAENNRIIAEQQAANDAYRQQQQQQEAAQRQIEQIEQQRNSYQSSPSYQPSQPSHGPSLPSTRSRSPRSFSECMAGAAQIQNASMRRQEEHNCRCVYGKIQGSCGVH